MGVGGGVLEKCYIALYRVWGGPKKFSVLYNMLMVPYCYYWYTKCSSERHFAAVQCLAQLIVCGYMLSSFLSFTSQMPTVVVVCEHCGGRTIK